MGRLRTFVAASALMMALVGPGQAADYSPPHAFPGFLRGTESEPVSRPTYPNWDGFYFGGQAGKIFASSDFGNADNSLVGYMLANTELQSIVTNFTTLPKGSTGGLSYGGFIGYNYQTDDVILGAELNYNHMSLGIGAQDSLGPLLIPGANLPDGSTVLYSVTVTSAASVSIHDILTARARAGWAFDRFMPYGFAGLAVGRFDTYRYATLAGSTKTTTSTATPPVITTGPLILPRDPQTDSRSDLIAYGFTAGLGVDVSLLPNLFLRAEWEFVQFPNVSDFRITTNSARVGLGLKF
jgi:outer membrane immunogenic protein